MLGSCPNLDDHHQRYISKIYFARRSSCYFVNYLLLVILFVSFQNLLQNFLKISFFFFVSRMVNFTIENFLSLYEFTCLLSLISWLFSFFFSIPILVNVNNQIQVRLSFQNAFLISFQFIKYRQKKLTSKREVKKSSCQ